MKKIPMLFERDMSRSGTDRSKIYHDVDFEKFNPKALERIRNAKNIRATIKYDGTATKIEDGKLYVRRQVKVGKPFPNNYQLEETDPATGKSFGWEPIEQSSYYKIAKTLDISALPNGTYELCGPKVQPRYSFTNHRLIPHGKDVLYVDVDFEHPKTTAIELYSVLHTALRQNDEGIVLWGEIDGIDQPLVKLRVRDYQSAIQDDLRLPKMTSTRIEKL